MTHRSLLFHLGEGGSELGEAELATAADDCSTRERDFSRIELKGDDVALCFLLERRLQAEGWEQTFTGEIVGLVGGGLFVRFGDVFEGFLSSRRLGGERMEVSEHETALVGESTGTRYRLGDAIDVKVERVDRLTGKVDLAPARAAEAAARHRRQPPPGAADHGLAPAAPPRPRPRDPAQAPLTARRLRPRARAARRARPRRRCGTLGGMPRETGIKRVAENRKARHDYFIDDTFEAGIALVGTEVKSLREGRINLRDSYVEVRGSAHAPELFLVGAHISPYDQGNIWNHDPLRARKLLMHRHEIERLAGKVREKGYTIVPTKVYFKDGRAKVEIGLGARQEALRQAPRHGRQGRQAGHAACLARTRGRQAVGSRRHHAAPAGRVWRRAWTR